MKEFLTKEQFENLKRHRYVVEGRSLLEEHLLRHFWDWLLPYFPRNMAPNLMTLLGVVAMVTPCIAMMIASPDAKNTAVPPIYLYGMALGLFIFQTLDNLDGRQARRTNCSNALGEYFDHGCDTISDAAMSNAFFIAITLGNNMNFLFFLGMLVPLFDYCFYWRAHWTGKYVFTDIDISEIQWIQIMIITLSAVTESTGFIWTNTFFNLFELRTLLIWIYVGFAVYYLGDVWFDALRIGLLGSGSTPDQRSNVLAPMQPLLAIFSLAITARYFSDGLFEAYPIPFICIYVLVASKLSCRLLIANMSKTRMPALDSSMIAFAFLFLANKSITPSFLQLSPSAALFVAGSVALFDFIKYVTNTCFQLADFLDVNVLTLKEPSSSKEQ